jgi:hypothetical protein
MFDLQTLHASLVSITTKLLPPSSINLEAKTHAVSVPLHFAAKKDNAACGLHVKHGAKRQWGHDMEGEAGKPSLPRGI